MDYLPVMLDVRGRRCLVVGGGIVAARKVELLLGAGAIVTVVAPSMSDTLRKLATRKHLQLIVRQYISSDLDEAALVVVATDQSLVNRRIALAARKNHVPVNVVDNPSLCTFVFPAIVDRSPLLVAISSSGAAPVLTRLLRARVEAAIPSTYGRLAAFAGRLRAYVRQQLPDPRARRRFWEATLDGPIADQVLRGDETGADHRVRNELKTTTRVAQGSVALVGAGPGDPDLLTLRGLRAMQNADVVLHDALVSEPIMNLVRREADRINVGKRCGGQAMRQDEINTLLVRLAQEGKRVVRLKGGDPFVFGRGGEEMEALRHANIPVEVVPGITAAIGCAASTGIPLTHRDRAQAVVFATAHTRTGDYDWTMLARPHQTVVFYMAGTQIPDTCRQLIVHGLPPAWPVAVVENGTRPEQRTAVGTLGEFASARTHVCTPALMIVGQVVAIRAQAELSHSECEDHWPEPSRQSR